MPGAARTQGGPTESGTMQDSEWSAPPAPKKRIPTWAWWTCGGGCLFALITIGVLVLFFARLVERATDPEAVWTELRAVLPCDQPPADWEIVMGLSVGGSGQYQLRPPRPERCLFQVQLCPEAALLDAYFDPDSSVNAGVLGLGALRDPVLGTFQLQGRAVRSLRFTGGLPDGADGAGLRLDLSGASERHAFVHIVVAGATEPLSDAEVNELFAPFDLWRSR